MSRPSIRLAVVLTLVLLLAAPALAWHKGPPSDDNGDGTGDPTARVGCTCHNNGNPSADILIKVTGVPHAYQTSTDYTMTLTLSHPDNSDGGFILTTQGNGTFSWDAGQLIRPEKDSNEPAESTSTTSGISQSDPTNPAEWTFTWTSPETDVGDVIFWLAGNMVDGGGAPDTTDYWNTLSFVISSPSETSAAADQSTRVISEGDYSLFEVHDDSAAIEQARQDELSENVMASGSSWFFTTLVALIVGGVLQREILERKHGTGPSHLDRQLAYPEGLRRGLLSAGLAILGLYWLDGGEGAYLWATAFFCSAWAAYGVYRTVLSTRTPPSVKDIM